MIWLLFLLYFFFLFFWQTVFDLLYLKCVYYVCGSVAASGCIKSSHKNDMSNSSLSQLFICFNRHKIFTGNATIYYRLRHSWLNIDKVLYGRLLFATLMPSFRRTWCVCIRNHIPKQWRNLISYGIKTFNLCFKNDLNGMFRLPRWQRRKNALNGLITEHWVCEGRFQCFSARFFFSPFTFVCILYVNLTIPI